MSFSKSLNTLDIPEKTKIYVTQVVNPVLRDLVHVLVRDQPQNAHQYLYDYLSGHAEVHAGKFENISSADVNCIHATSVESSIDSVSSVDSDGRFSGRSAGGFVPTGSMMKSRAAVSAEAYGDWNKRVDLKPPVFDKTGAERSRIRELLANSFLFSNVDSSDLDVIIEAFQPITVPLGMNVIQEGEVGDFLCIIEDGALVCIKGSGSEERTLRTCGPGDVVGELALLYNAPRAATVRTACDSKLWRLDSRTFVSIVRDGSIRKRERYEDFLSRVEVLSALGPYERSQVADALVARDFGPNQDIVTEGDRGDIFYILESGSVEFFKHGELVNTYDRPGEYFGELALLHDEPRAATVKTGPDGCRVLTLDRPSFIRLLGNLDELSTKHY